MATKKEVLESFCQKDHTGHVNSMTELKSNCLFIIKNFEGMACETM